MIAAKRVRIRANLSEGAARTGPIAKDSRTKYSRISGRCDQSHAGDILLLPIALIAFLDAGLRPCSRRQMAGLHYHVVFRGIRDSRGDCVGRLWTKQAQSLGRIIDFIPRNFCWWL